MIKFRNFDQIEHKYAFENAVAGADTFNGSFGTVSSGSFSSAEDGTKVIMQALPRVHSICILKINMISAINWFRMNPASCLNMQPPILRSIV